VFSEINETHEILVKIRHHAKTPTRPSFAIDFFGADQKQHLKLAGGWAGPKRRKRDLGTKPEIIGPWVASCGKETFGKPRDHRRHEVEQSRGALISQDMLAYDLPCASNRSNPQRWPRVPGGFQIQGANQKRPDVIHRFRILGFGTKQMEAAQALEAGPAEGKTRLAGSPE